MKILIVSQNFWPESFRSNDIAFELVKRGYKVDVLAGIPDYPEGFYYKGYGVFSKRIQTINGVKTKTIVGSSSPVNLDTEGIEIHEILLTKNYSHKSEANKTYSIYVVDGEVSINKNNLIKDDFAIINNTVEIKFETNTKAKLFIISSLKQPSYKTYMNY